VFTDTFDTQRIQTATQTAIRNFMSHRANAITSSEPDGTRGDGRLTGWLFGGGAPNSGGSPAGGSNLMGAPDASSVSSRQGSTPREDASAGDASGARTALYSPFRLSGNAEDGSGSILFSTSLSRMRQAAAEAQAAKDKDGEANHMGLGGRGTGQALVPSTPPMWDIWLEGHTNFCIRNSTKIRSRHRKLMRKQPRVPRRSRSHSGNG